MSMKLIRISKNSCYTTVVNYLQARFSNSGTIAVSVGIIKIKMLSLNTR